MELIEAYGTGILRIIEAYSETRKEPEIEASDNAFKIFLPNRNIKAEHETQNADKSVIEAQEEAVIAETDD